MRKLFFLFALTVVAVSLAGLAVAQQGSAGSSNSSQTGQKSNSGPSQAAQQQGSSTSAPNDIPTPDDEPSATNGSKAPSNPSHAAQHASKNTKAQNDKNAAQNQRAPRSDDPEPLGDDPVTAPPATAGESSSKDTKIDLSPPPGDANEHPDSSVDEEESSGTTEFRAWDPHRAMKNVEVGDYYFKQQNYRAAASRYQEALQWKPRDAEATFKLALAYEKLGDTIDARNNYETYLKILPKGPRAEDAQKAMARLK